MAVAVSKVFQLKVVPEAPFTVKVADEPLQIVAFAGLAIIEMFTGLTKLIPVTATVPNAPTAGSVTLAVTFAEETLLKINVALPVLSVVTVLDDKLAVPASRDMLSGVFVMGLLF
jgi:hypothetical protein